MTRQSVNKTVFLVHDAVMIRGESLIDQPLTERLDKARALCRTILSKTPFVTVVKTMVPLADISKIEKGQYVTDGLIFTPVHEPIRTGTHETLFKWKPRERITIDFVIYSGARLFVQDKGVPYEEAELHLRNARPDIPDGTIVECGYNDLGFFVEKIRTDKTHANNRRTYFRTIVNIRENIQLEEFSGTMPCRTGPATAQRWEPR